MANNLAVDGTIIGGAETLVSPTMSGSVKVGTVSTDTLGFYGSAPVTQITDANQAAVSSTAVASVSSTAVVSVSATQWCFTTSTQGLSVLNSIGSLITQSNSRAVQAETIRANLVTLGLIKGS